VLALACSCTSSPPITPLTNRDCPEGATVAGAAPPAGTLQRCELSGGVRHGPSRAWYDDGRLRYETEWWQGVKHGKFTFWYPNGQKRAEGQDRYGVPAGTWTSWTEDGAVAQAQVFQASGQGTASGTPEIAGPPGLRATPAR
jgi:MORN repeat variant